VAPFFHCHFVSSGMLFPLPLSSPWHWLLNGMIMPLPFFRYIIFSIELTGCVCFDKVVQLECDRVGSGWFPPTVNAGSKDAGAEQG
jgi:hypothetical protein